MPTDRENITERYLGIISEATEKSIKRIDKSTIEVDGQTKDITNWLREITDGGREMLAVWTVRRRDKIVDGELIARAGDALVLNGKLGPCAREVKGVGSPLGTPKERYEKYDLITICVNREGEFHTRHVATDQIYKIKSGLMTYNIG